MTTTPAVRELGYLVIEATDLERWRSFLADALGLAVTESASGELVARMDDHARRITVVEGPADDVTAVGFEAASTDDLDQIASRLRGRGIDVVDGGETTTRDRHVDRLVSLTDPNGLPVEVFVGAETADPPATPLVPSGFVTGDQGLGHIVIVARDVEATAGFYADGLGFAVSDYIAQELAPGLTVEITFLHVNPRHHTVAFTQAPLPKRIHHFMVEARSVDDVGAALDRCIDGGHPISQALGRHPNDQMLSFYVQSPSGFDVELGCGGLRIDDATWEVTTHDRMSTWGHKPPALMGAG